MTDVPMISYFGRFTNRAGILRKLRSSLTLFHRPHPDPQRLQRLPINLYSQAGRIGQSHCAALVSLGRPGQNKIAAFGGPVGWVEGELDEGGLGDGGGNMKIRQ